MPSFIKNHVTKNCTKYTPKNPAKYVGKDKLILDNLGDSMELYEIEGKIVRNVAI